MITGAGHAEVDPTVLTRTLLEPAAYAKLDARGKGLLVHTSATFTELLIQQGLVRFEQYKTVPGKVNFKLGMNSEEVCLISVNESGVKPQDPAVPSECLVTWERVIWSGLR